MLQSRVMILRPRRIGLLEPSRLPARKLSMSTALAENTTSRQSNSSKSSPEKPKRLQIPPALLKFKSSNSDKPRPRRFVDARSLAASRTGGQPANILRGPNRPGDRGGSRGGARKPQFSKSGSRGRNFKPRRRQDNSDSGLGKLEPELEQFYRELAEKSQPKLTRFQPQLPSLENLSETWPSVPAGVTATTAGVTEKLSSLSDRYANDYVPPYELGKRLFEGKYVRFRSEEEKIEALEVAKKYSQEAAEKLSSKKGELVDPQPVNFEGAKEENHRFLIESLAQGKYPAVETPKTNSSPIVADILRNLRNNETYHVAGKSSQFMAKLESLLPTNRPVKRA